MHSFKLALVDTLLAMANTVFAAPTTTQGSVSSISTPVAYTPKPIQHPWERVNPSGRIHRTSPARRDNDDLYGNVEDLKVPQQASNYPEVYELDDYPEYHDLIYNTPGPVIPDVIPDVNSEWIKSKNNGSPPHPPMSAVEKREEGDTVSEQVNQDLLERLRYIYDHYKPTDHLHGDTVERRDSSTLPLVEPNDAESKRDSAPLERRQGFGAQWLIKLANQWFQDGDWPDYESMAVESKREETPTPHKREIEKLDRNDIYIPYHARPTPFRLPYYPPKAAKTEPAKADLPFKA